MLASLNHPNIATLHGFEQDGETAFLVMEVVEGVTLAERLERGALALDEAKRIFTQIAEGLEAAHEKGIVHRDLKPANVKITDEGLVKVLDFGLAKATEKGSAQKDSTAATLTDGGTRQGAIMGTAAYMAPEQARGETVDSRADVWAFGVCLYEALTGKPCLRRSHGDGHHGCRAHAGARSVLTTRVDAGRYASLARSLSAQGAPRATSQCRRRSPRARGGARLPGSRQPARSLRFRSAIDGFCRRRHSREPYSRPARSG